MILHKQHFEQRIRLKRIFKLTSATQSLPWASPSYSRFTLDGGSTPIFPYESSCEEAMEGNCYVEVYPECRVASMHHQLTS